MRRAEVRDPRAGAALLEVLVALALLVTAGTALIALAAQSAAAVKRARDADAEMRRANAFFEVVSLWPREDLDRRLGDRAQGPWRLRIDRPAPTLYVAILSDSASHRELLHTALFRPDAAAAPNAPR